MGEPVFLSHAQVEKPALACPGYELFVHVLAYTGMRWGEAPPSVCGGWT